jgi:hypothetical protein
MALSAPAPISTHHQIGDFSSGIVSLDEWLKRRALAYQATGAARTFVVCEAWPGYTSSKIRKRKAPQINRSGECRAGDDGQAKVVEAKAPVCYICFMKRDEAISRLRQHEADLKRLGVEHLYMFGSTAPGEAGDDSGVHG